MGLGRTNFSLLCMCVGNECVINSCVYLQLKTFAISFNFLQSAMTPQGTFWLFAAVCFTAFIYGFIFLPETRGKSLEEIQSLFENRSRNNYQEVDNSDAEA